MDLVSQSRSRCLTSAPPSPGRTEATRSVGDFYNCPPEIASRPVAASLRHLLTRCFEAHTPCRGTALAHISVTIAASLAHARRGREAGMEPHRGEDQRIRILDGAAGITGERLISNFERQQS